MSLDVEQAHMLLNRVEIPGPSGFPLLEIWEGDILSWPGEMGVLFVSVTVRALEMLSRGVAKPGQRYLIDQLLNGGLDVCAERDRSLLRLEQGLGLWISRRLKQSKENLIHPQRLVCVHRVGFDEAGVRRTFADAFASLAILEAHGERLGTVVLPLLGAGGMNLEMELLAPIIVQSARDGLRRLTSVNRLVIIERDPSRAHNISKAVDDHLGFSGRSVRDSKLFELVREDLLVRLTAAEVKEATTGLYQELISCLRTESPPPSVLATSGRKIAERIVQVHGGRGSNLAKQIEDLRNHGVPRWVVGYLHLLRQFGNELSHDQGVGSRRASHEDLATAMVCLLRVLEFQDGRGIL